MFTTDAIIDSIQSSQKTFVSTFILEDKVRKPINALVDAQTAFTKQIVKSFTDISSFVSEETTNAVKKASKVS